MNFFSQKRLLLFPALPLSSPSLPLCARADMKQKPGCLGSAKKGAAPAWGRCPWVTKNPECMAKPVSDHCFHQGAATVQGELGIPSGVRATSPVLAPGCPCTRAKKGKLLLLDAWRLPKHQGHCGHFPWQSRVAFGRKGNAASAQR